MMLYPAAGYPAEYFPLTGTRELAILDLIGTVGIPVALFGTVGVAVDIIGSSDPVLDLDGSVGD